MGNHLDLVRAEQAELVDALIAERHAVDPTDPQAPSTPAQPFGTYVFSWSEPGASLARAAEREVFFETFGDTPDLLAAEYAPYEAASVFFVVVDHRRRVPAGMMRVIMDSPAGFKSLEDLMPVWGVSPAEALRSIDAAWDLTHVWDFATLAVSREYRGEATLGLVTQALLQALTTVGQRSGGTHFVAILDAPVMRMLQWRLGRPFEPFPGLHARSYLGSASSIPVWGELARWDRQLELADPVLHEVIFRARGLEPIVSTPDWDEAAELVARVTGVVQSPTDDIGVLYRPSAAGSASGGIGRE